VTDEQVRILHCFTDEEVDMLNTALGTFIQKEQGFLRMTENDVERARWGRLHRKIRTMVYGEAGL
jgi:hypothetical protein